MSGVKHVGLILILLVIFLAATWSLYTPGLFRIHDYTHAARIAEMARGMQDGQLPVRWSANFGYGYGMPLFVFYAPLPYIVGALFWLSGMPIEWSVKLLFLLPTAITLVSAFFLARRWLPDWGATLATAAVVLAPYRAVNLFVRGAVSESWGMAFFVVALLGIALTYDKKRWGWIVFVTGLAGIVLSHNITLVLSGALLTGFAGLLFLEDRLKKPRSLAHWWHAQRHILWALLGSGALAVGLTAFYWLPALTLKNASQLDQYILSDYFNFRLHFLYIRQFFQPNWAYGGSSWGPTDDISFFLGWGQLLGVAISSAVGLVVVTQSALGKRLRTFGQLHSAWVIGFGILVLSGVALLLSLQKSATIWEYIPFLKYVQFPWRFLAVATPLFGLFSAWWVLGNIPRTVQVLVGFGLFGLLLFNAQYFQPEQWLEKDSRLYETASAHIQTGLSSTLVDYIPVGFVEPSEAHRPDVLPHEVTCSEECQVTLMAQDSRQTLLQVESQNSNLITVGQSYFPGWMAEVDGELTAITPGNNAVITVAVPAGSSLVGLWFGRTPIVVAADFITVLSLAALLFLVTRINVQYAKK